MQGEALLRWTTTSKFLNIYMLFAFSCVKLLVLGDRAHLSELSLDQHQGLPCHHTMS